MSRRTLLKGGGAAFAGLTTMQVTGPAHAFPGQGDEVIPWLDQPPVNPVPSEVGNLLDWEALDSWLTPTDNFFTINHYGPPPAAAVDPATWRLGIGGLVAQPQSLTLADLQARPRREVTFTLECSGNTGTGLPWFIGGIGDAPRAGPPLAPPFGRAGVLAQGTEVVVCGGASGRGTDPRNSPGG